MASSAHSVSVSHASNQPRTSSVATSTTSTYLALFFTLVAPERARVKDAPKPVGKPKSSPRLTVIGGGLA